MGLGVIVGSCCIVRTVLTDESLPQDSTCKSIQGKNRAPAMLSCIMAANARRA